MNDQPTYWDKCRTCGKTIGFSTKYWTCSVSTCNRKGNPLVFCSVDCWDVHAPVMNHKNAGAEENMAPPRTGGEKRRVLITSPKGESSKSPSSSSSSSSPSNSSAPSREILIVASKLKSYIRERSGMNTSAEVMDRLSDLVRNICDEAIVKARADGRKTVMNRDLP